MSSDLYALQLAAKLAHHLGCDIEVSGPGGGPRRDRIERVNLDTVELTKVNRDTGRRVTLDGTDIVWSYGGFVVTCKSTHATVGDDE